MVDRFCQPFSSNTSRNKGVLHVLAVGYALFEIGGALWVLFLGRIMDGLTAGNFNALFGMLGDSTAPEERGQYFG